MNVECGFSFYSTAHSVCLVWWCMLQKLSMDMTAHEKKTKRKRGNKVRRKKYDNQFFHYTYSECIAVLFMMVAEVDRRWKQVKQPTTVTKTHTATRHCRFKMSHIWIWSERHVFRLCSYSNFDFSSFKNWFQSDLCVEQ